MKRLVSIEDLGNITLLFTDKTGTLTEGHITFDRAVGARGAPAERTFLLGLVCNEAVLDGRRAVSGNALDVALWNAADEVGRERQRASGSGSRRARSITNGGCRRSSPTRPTGERWLVVKGEPEGVLARSDAVPPAAAATLTELYDAGARVIAVAARPRPGSTSPTDADEQRPRASSASSCSSTGRRPTRPRRSRGSPGSGSS